MDTTSRTQYAVRRRFKPITAASIVFVHLVALLAVFPYFFSWAGLITCLVLIWATASLGISMSYHRMLSHKSWRARPWLRNVLTFLACLTLEMGPISWSATHRLHHRESDHEDDPHSPLVSFFWAHMGWLFVTHPIIDDERRKKQLAPDLYRDPVMRFFERNYVWMWVGLAAVMLGAGYLIGGMKLALSLLIWGGFLRTVFVWHATWFVNSVTHLWGYRNYQTTDDSRNLWWVALVTFGEGWHNNHHARAGTANFGHKWWEFDPTYWMLALFNKLGWVEKVNLAEPLPAFSPVKVLDGKIAAQSRALKSLLRRKSPLRAES